jgi:peptidoglycan L-alanyl-D-glutamate endopeptidase CwlK
MTISRKNKLLKIFLIAFFAFIIFVLFYHSGFSYVRKPVPMPTEINLNFLTQINDCFIPVAAVYGYTLRITTGFRSTTTQELLYQQGRTINGHIITEAEAGKSIHNYGYAVDVVDRWRGYNINWDKLVKIGNYCGLESGGEGDLPHFEERSGLTTADFAAGLRPPLLTLPCPIMADRASATSTHSLTLKDLNNCGAPKF